MAPTPFKLTSASPTVPKLPPSPRLPFVQGPSRIILHRNPASPQVPQTALLLSMPMTQKLAALLTVSRRISSLAKSVLRKSSPNLTPLTINEGTKAQVEQLEEQYESLRVEIEEEIESAFVGAGFLLPRSSSEAFSAAHRSLSNGFEDQGQVQRPWQRKDSREETQPMMLTSMDSSQAVVPRTPLQRKRMREWDWESGCRRELEGKIEDEEMISPGSCKKRRVSGH